MANLHCRIRIQTLTRIRIPNQMATLYYAEHVHIAQTRTSIPTPYFQGSHSDWKTWENRKAFSSQGKSQEILENSGNFRQMLFIITILKNGKRYWKNQEILSVQKSRNHDFCTGQESESESESVSGNVNEPLHRAPSCNEQFLLHLFNRCKWDPVQIPASTYQFTLNKLCSSGHGRKTAVWW